MKLYTEAELLMAIKYACEYQKATDYQTVGALLICEDQRELEENLLKVLDALADGKIISNEEIDLRDIFHSDKLS